MYIAATQIMRLCHSNYKNIQYFEHLLHLLHLVTKGGILY
jgi:hypothetical protein